MALCPKRRVCYYYDDSIGAYYYGKGHPMKPQRIRMTHELIVHYGLFQKMDVYCPLRAKQEEMIKFHSEEYINFIRQSTPEKEQKYLSTRDCPAFYGLYEFCQITTGGSVAGAVKLNKRETDIAINWSGGLHHAKKTEASGFCYVNDIVLAILELLKYHQRVLYIDIDVHHGDGVEQAFYTTDRVMTVSFHKFGDLFFPGTGNIKDVGSGSGKYYAVNFPLREGIDDETYQRDVFQPVISEVMEMYQPSAVVLQCGADSLSGDRLGCFNLTLKGHGECVKFVMKYNLPLLLLGGGGYTIRNVARCWAYETAIALNVDVPNELPHNEYVDYFEPDFNLHIYPSNVTNQNSPEYIESIKTSIFENLRMTGHAPGVQMQPVPVDAVNTESTEVEENRVPTQRMCLRAFERRVVGDVDSSDSDDEDYEIPGARLKFRKRKRKTTKK